MTDDLSPELRTWAEATLGSRVLGAEAIGQGASRRIWALALAEGDDVVLRVDTGVGPVTGTPLDLRREGAVYGALSGSGLPVPMLLGTHPDGRALLLERARGSEDLSSLGDDERAAVAEDYGRCLADLHGLDPGALVLGPLAVPAGTTPTASDLALWRSISESRCGATASPVVAVALDRLDRSEPEAVATALCHGDAGTGNFLQEGGRVTALLDWEFAHLGDPHDDLAWVAVRDQLLGRPLEVARVVRAWCERSGRAVDVARLEWFRTLVLTRMLVSCDATLAWAPDAESSRVQAALQPFLAAAVVEALRRSGLADAAVDALEAPAREVWAASPLAGLLDPSDLDPLGALP